MAEMKSGATHRTTIHMCPSCGETLDAVTGVDTDDGDDKPSPGDITVCIYCGHIMALADDLSPRKLSDDEIKEVAGDKRILAAQQARAMMDKVLDEDDEEDEEKENNARNIG